MPKELKSTPTFEEVKTVLQELAEMYIRNPNALIKAADLVKQRQIGKNPAETAELLMVFDEQFKSISKELWGAMARGEITLQSLFEDRGN